MGSRQSSEPSLVVTGLFAFDARAQPMTAVTQLGWLRNGEYAPIMMAEAKGFFKEEGIDHKIVDGGPGKNPIPSSPSARRSSGWRPTAWRWCTARLAKDPVDVVASRHAVPAGADLLSHHHRARRADRQAEGHGRQDVGTQAGTEFIFTGLRQEERHRRIEGEGR